MRPFDLTGAHGAWQMLANIRLRDSGLTAHDIVVVLRIGVAAVLQSLREAA
jgi:hypothetical protein